jgi:hypothetical protein
MPTYYVDTSVGNDGNAGTSEGAGNAWATTVIAGDKVWVKASGTYVEDPAIDTAGGTTTPIVFEGYQNSTGDNGKVTISGVTNCLTTTLGSGESRYIFKNIIFNGGTGAAVSMGVARANSFINCEFVNSDSNGFEGGGTYNQFINCVFSNNAHDGLTATAMTAGHIVGCTFHSNGRTGCEVGAVDVFYRNLIYNNDTDAVGWKHADLGSTKVIIGNTFDGENRAANLAENDGQQVFLAVDNVFYDSGTYGLTNSATTSHFRSFAGYNLFNDNTSGTYADAGDPELIGYQGSPAVNAAIQPGGIT